MSEDRRDLAAAIEAILFAAAEPVGRSRLAEAIGADSRATTEALDYLKKALEERGSGLMLDESAGGYQLGTRPEHGATIRRLLARTRRFRLSKAAFETLAVIAYRQPCTRAEVEKIRGVNVDGVIQTLMQRELVRIVGKKDDIGNPLLFGTTREFLVRFGLKRLEDLPPIEEFVEMAITPPEELDEGSLKLESKPELEALADAAARELANLGGSVAGFEVPSLVEFPEESAPVDSAPSIRM